LSDELGRRLEDAAALERQLRAEIEAKQRELDEAHENNDHLVGELKELSDRANVNSDRESQLREEIESLRKTVDALRKESADLRRSIKANLAAPDGKDGGDGSSKYQKLQKRFREIAAFNDTLSGLIERAHNRNRELDEELSTLRMEVIGNKRKAQNQKEKIDALSSEIERLLLENANLNRPGSPKRTN
jgi:chromosome segregation ATPase